MNKLRKFIVLSVMVLTVVAMSGITVANASASAGDLIKMDGLSSVYYLGDDGNRYVFPNEATFFSWYSDFSGVVTIPATELQSYALGGNVTMRAGTKLVKITTDPSVYAVEDNGVLRKIQSEAQATALYGLNWNKVIVDVPDAFFTNYTIGSVLADGSYAAGTLVKNASSSDIYYYDGTDYRMIANEAAFAANRFNMANVLTGVVTGSGVAITGAEFTNTAQSGGSGNVPVSTGTGVMISLASNTPAARTVPTGATAVALTSFNVTASADGDIVLQGLVAKKTGVGASTELTKVYVYEGDTRLSNGRTISSSTNTATFSSLNITIPAGTTKTLSLVGDVSGTGEHFLGIESAAAITAGGATVSGSFPIVGNKISLSSTPVGQTDIENANAYTVKSGELQVEVGRLAVYVNSTEDGQLESLTLYNSSRDILKNLTLYRASDKVATATQSGDSFTFVLDTPYLIKKSESATFTVKADVVGARDADTANLYVRYKTDLKVKGMTYGYYLAPTQAQGTAAVSAIDEIATTRHNQAVTVEAGQVTIASSGPVASSVASNSKDVVLMDFTITTVAAVDVEKVGILLKDSGALAADVTNLELLCGGSIVAEWAAPTEATSGAGGGINTDTSVWSLPANATTVCKVRIDIESTKVADTTLSADWDYSNWTFKDSNTGDTITDIIPSTDIAGQSMTVTASSLTVTQANTPTSQTWVSGASFDAMGLNFAAGDATDIKVTNLVLRAALDENAADGYDYTTAATPGRDNSIYGKDVISSVEIYDGTTKIGSTKVVTTAGIVTFDSLAWVIPASANKVLTVKVTTSTNAPYNSTDDLIKFFVSSVTSEYGSGTGLTADITAIDVVTEATVFQTIATSGTLTAVIDTNTPASALVLMGATTDMTKVKFTSVNEAFVVEKLQVANTTGTTDNASYASVTITYPTLTGTGTKTGTFVGDLATFTGLDFYVAKDADAILTISGTFNSKTAGATSDTTTAVDLATTGFRAVAQASGTVDTTTDTALGQDMYLYESVPTIAFASDTPSGNLIPGANTLLAKIGITASAQKSITFDSTGTVAGVRTLTVTNAQSAAEPAAANIVVPTSAGGTANISVDVAASETAAAIGVKIRAAVDAHADWIATDNNAGVVTITAASIGAWSTTAVDVSALNTALTTAVVADAATATVGTNKNLLTIQLALSRADDATANDDSITLKKADGTVLDTITAHDFDGTTEFTFDFSTAGLTVAAGTTEYVYVYGTTTDFEDAGDSIQVWLDDTAADATFGINATGTYARGNILFKGDLFGGSIVKP